MAWTTARLRTLCVTDRARLTQHESFFSERIETQQWHYALPLRVLSSLAESTRLHRLLLPLCNFKCYIQTILRCDSKLHGNQPCNGGEV